MEAVKTETTLATVRTPDIAGIALNPGEVYAGILLGKNGAASHHLVLLSGEREDINWNDATEWAASIGGELPTRREQALLFANLPEEFQRDWYWSGEQLAAYADYAWNQNFGNGIQHYFRKSYEGRARAVRRLPI